MHRVKVTLLALLVFSLGSCGFALRGSDSLSANFSTLQLYSEQPNSEFARLLQRSLEGADVEISLVDLSNLDSEVAVLAIANEQLSTRPVTINPRARAAQIELRLSIVIAVNVGDTSLVEPETLFAERIYFQDVENISGNQEEAEIIAAEMRRELIQQLLRRLSVIETS